MHRATIKHLPAAALMALAAITSAGCGDSDGPQAGNGRGSSEPVYVIYTTIDTQDLRTGHFVTTPSIEGDLPIDVTKGIEEPGGGQLYAPAGEGYFLLAGGEAPTFTRYGLDAAGNLEKGKTVSFANLGVKETWGHVIFVDANKAYFLDASQLQVVSFNPTTMEIHRAIPVPDFKCEEMVTSFGMPVRRDDGFYFPRSCWDLDQTSSGATLVHLDPRTDQVTVTQDARCMGMQVGFLAAAATPTGSPTTTPALNGPIRDATPPMTAPCACGPVRRRSTRTGRSTSPPAPGGYPPWQRCLAPVPPSG